MALQKNNKVALGLSGGVDSAVAGLLLKAQGYDVTGIYIQCWDAKLDGCKADEDRASAVANASVLDIKFDHLDFRAQYKSKVMEYFYSEYAAGRTPNPDVVCNKEIKFGLFYNWAQQQGYEYVATGHYAQVQSISNGYNLVRAEDQTKDQSYFLYLLKQEQLAHILFPLGKLLKKEVRNIAQKHTLPSANRPDSTGICFIGEVDIKKFLKKRIKPQNGIVRYVDGNVIGEHEGVWFYTIGQRHGFNLTTYFGEPLYVVAKNITENELIVGTHKDAYVDSFTISNTHWINEPQIEGYKNTKLAAEVRIRHLGKLHTCELSNLLTVKLPEPIFGVAAGQSAVFYLNNSVLGGGIIN